LIDLLKSKDMEVGEQLEIDLGLVGGVRRRLVNSTSPKGAWPKEAFPKAAGRDSVEPRRLQNGLEHCSTADGFNSNGGESAMGICEGFDNHNLQGRFGMFCSDNPLSANSLGGCLTSMQPGISIGVKKNLPAECYGPPCVPPHAGGQLVIVSPDATSAMGWTPGAPGLVSFWRIDEAHIQFDPPVKAVSFCTGDGFGFNSISLTVEDSTGAQLGVVDSGTGLSFVGLVSTGEPIKTTKHAKTAGEFNCDADEFVDHICFSPDLSARGGGGGGDGDGANGEVSKRLG